MSEPSSRSYQESVTVVAPAEALYDMVSDVTRTGEWSPVCTSCWWDEQAQAGQVGAWFTGHNELPHRTRETRSEVVVAERGRAFARHYDPQSIHTDPAWSATGPFNGLIASGVHTIAVCMRLYVDHYISRVASLASARATRRPTEHPRHGHRGACLALQT